MSSNQIPKMKLIIPPSQTELRAEWMRKELARSAAQSATTTKHRLQNNTLSIKEASKHPDSRNLTRLRSTDRAYHYTRKRNLIKFATEDNSPAKLKPTNLRL